MNKTSTFWNNAAQSLPAPYRARYQGYFERAERWELAFDSFVELLDELKSRAKPAYGNQIVIKAIKN